MGVSGRGFRYSFVIVVFDPVGVFLFGFFWFDWKDLLFFKKFSKGNDANISILITQDYEAFFCLIVVNGMNKSYLGTFLNAVHIFPVCDQRIWGFLVVLSSK